MTFAMSVMAQIEAAGPGTVAGLWLSRILTYLSLSVVVGALVAAGWILKDGGGRVGPVGARAMRVAAVGAAAWVVASVGLFVFGLANATARPVAEVLDGAVLGRFLVSRYGSGVAVQTVVAAGVTLLAAVARDRAFARATTLVVAVGAAALARAGHAGTTDVPLLGVASDTVHIMAAAAWVGGLGVLLALVARRGVADQAGPALRFSRFAGWALAAVLATGVVNSVLHLDDPGQLLDTTWGRLVLVKLGLLGGIGALGGAHRRRTIARLTAGAVLPGAFRRLALAEIGLMVLAFVTATAMVSGTPADVEAAARVQAVRTSFADGIMEVTLAPAEVGRNELHLYFFDDAVAPRDVEDPTVTLRTEERMVEARLVPSGLGHYTGPVVDLPDAGAYQVEVTGLVEGRRERSTTTMTIE